MVVSTICPQNLRAPCTCHRVRTLLIFALDATIFSRRSPDFHSSLRPGSFFLPMFGCIEFSQSSRSSTILRHRQTGGEREARPRVLCELLQISVEFVLIQQFLVVIVERLESVDIFFVFGECCHKFRFLRHDLWSRMRNNYECPEGTQRVEMITD